MSHYNYYENVTEDAKDFICENIDQYNYFDSLFDEMFVSDYVTGNASGSYTFNAYTAQQYINDALWDEEINYLFEANGEDIFEVAKKGPEHLDVCIRCYVLSDLYSALEEFFQEQKQE